MKKIKLLVLLLAVLGSAVSVYAKSKAAFQLYYIVAGTSSSSFNYQVSSVAPSPTCLNLSLAYVCTVQADVGYATGSFIPADRCTIVNMYN